MLKPTNFSKYITSFLSSYLPGLRNVSKNTIASYCDTFRLLLKYCRDFRKIPLERLSLIDVNVEIITTFLNWVEEYRGHFNQKSAISCYTFIFQVRTS